ncbi:TetR/AcrR family transcriptional regulator [Lysinibacillus sp. BPa_S21]|uniref:TetR/AcrR family transcriptional regulator n=1 Tax=Lysinibacillus sp. BPa_S21 TaxID=2932478 RepID=UPI0020138DAA|nr:TetR/AcrR family transcriptional regulator [Lysinibacillus sp. BPa_S21]MCL1698433.1 TetR/AcrR family transcriptional regulator [Lysinibacillus sp. BPa_S21]
MASKKDKILEASLELFTKRGFTATTTKEIALKSGVAEGLIFYYFKDKNGLLNYLIREFSFIGSLQNEIKALSMMEPYPALIKFGQLYANFLSHNKSFLTFIWSPEIVRNTDVSKDIVDFINTMNEQVSSFLIRASLCSVEKKTVETAASVFLSTILTHVLVEERKAEKMPIGNNDYIEEVAMFLLKGMQIV